jgi:hypothetical protein
MLLHLLTAAYGTNATNGNDARRSACGGNPDIAWIIVKAPTLSPIGHRPERAIQNDSGLPQRPAGASKAT